MGASGSMWSQKILNMASMGTARRAPGNPQSQPQKLSPKKMTTGLSVSRRPIIKGLTKVPIAMISAKNVTGTNKA